MFIAENLPVFVAALVAFCVVVYVLADGFDLGVGILFLFAPREAERDLMMASIEPVWDGNETWLVMGGTLLLATFPAGYYVLLPAFYLPIVFMLFALIFRGVAFGFRLQTVRFRWAWNIAFAGGSIVATMCQGLILGGLINGVVVENGMFAGRTFDFMSILGIGCGIGLLGGYALLGAGWLIWKTDGSTQTFAKEVAHAALLLTAFMMMLVSAWSAWSVPEVAARWFARPTLGYIAPIPAVAAIALLSIWFCIWKGRAISVFLLSIGVFLCGFAGLVVSIWPYVVPRHVTVWNGASDPQTLVFAVSGTLLILPIVLGYQGFAYWIFRGKTVHNETSQDGVPSPRPY